MLKALALVLLQVSWIAAQGQGGFEGLEDFQKLFGQNLNGADEGGAGLPSNDTANDTAVDQGGLVPGGQPQVNLDQQMMGDEAMMGDQPMADSQPQPQPQPQPEPQPAAPEPVPTRAPGPAPTSAPPLVRQETTPSTTTEKGKASSVQGVSAALVLSAFALCLLN